MATNILTNLARQKTNTNIRLKFAFRSIKKEDHAEINDIICSAIDEWGETISTFAIGGAVPISKTTDLTDLIASGNNFSVIPADPADASGTYPNAGGLAVTAQELLDYQVFFRYIDGAWTKVLTYLGQNVRFDELSQDQKDSLVGPKGDPAQPHALSLPLDNMIGQDGDWGTYTDGGKAYLVYKVGGVWDDANRQEFGTGNSDDFVEVVQMAGGVDVLANTTAPGGYNPGRFFYNYPLTGGTGNGVVVDLKVNASGNLTLVRIVNPGSGYSVSDALTLLLEDGNNGNFTVSEIKNVFHTIDVSAENKHRFTSVDDCGIELINSAPGKIGVVEINNDDLWEIYLKGHGKLKRAYSYTIEWANVNGKLKFTIDGDWLIPGVTDMSGGLRVYPFVPYGQRKYLDANGDYQNEYYSYIAPMRLDMPIIPGVPIVFDVDANVISWQFLDKTRTKIGAKVTHNMFASGVPAPPANAKFMRVSLQNGSIMDNCIVKMTNKFLLAYKKQVTIVIPTDIVLAPQASSTITTKQRVWGVTRSNKISTISLPGPSDTVWNKYEVICEMIPRPTSNVTPEEFDYKFTNTSIADTHTIVAGTEITFDVQGGGYEQFQ